MKKVLVVLLLVVVAAAAYLAHLGAFKSVKITGEKMGPYNLLYVEQTGDYGLSGKNIMVVGDAVKALGVTPVAGFGIYKDNPRKVKKADLRADVGVIIADADLKKVAKLKKQFKSRKVAKRDSLTAEMPFKGKLSIIVGMIKVYPAMMKEAEAKNMQMTEGMEIYVPGKTITYVVVPVKK